MDTDKKHTNPRKRRDAIKSPKGSVLMQWLSETFPASWTMSEKAKARGRTMSLTRIAVVGCKMLGAANRKEPATHCR